MVGSERLEATVQSALESQSAPELLAELRAFG